MSAKKIIPAIILLSLLTSFSSISAQNETSNNTGLINSDEEKPQFLVRTEHNGKTKYVECALPNLYFHQATSATPGDESIQDDSEFTAKGGYDSNNEYHGYAFFLVQDGMIKACNDNGDFNYQPKGIYTLSRYSYPLSISLESFNGKNINTIENHPLFEKDASIQNMTIRLLAANKTEPAFNFWGHGFFR